MNDTAKSESGGTPARTGLTTPEANQLRRMYEQLSDAAAIAADALAKGPVVGTAFEWFGMLDARVTTLAGRVGKVLRFSREERATRANLIIPKESAELMQLYDELSELAAKARETLRSVPAGLVLQRLRTGNAGIDGKIDSIKAIVQ